MSREGTDWEEAVTWWATERWNHMETARHFREQLQHLEATDPDEFTALGGYDLVREHVCAARHANHSVLWCRALAARADVQQPDLFGASA